MTPDTFEKAAEIQQEISLAREALLKWMQKDIQPCRTVMGKCKEQAAYPLLAEDQMASDIWEKARKEQIARLEHRIRQLECQFAGL